jgi:hypothetical protein
MRLFLINLVPIFFIAGAFVLSYNEISGWGWFVGSAVLTHFFTIAYLNVEQNRNEEKQTNK